MNFKGLAYVTEWIEYPDIESHSKKLGIKPTGKKTFDGSDRYTLPAMHDSSTGVYLADSIVIAEYLDKTYPNSPPIFPHKTVGLQNTFMVAIGAIVAPIWEFTDLPAIGMLNPPSTKYFRMVRERAIGKCLEDAAPKGEYAVEQWNKLEANLRTVANWYARTDEIGPYFMGDEISWVDIVMTSYFAWLRVTFGEDGTRFRDIMEWDGGRWQRLYRDLQKFATIK